jgi:hypothetical protein
MSQMDLVYEMLRADLEAPRVLLDQVVNAISSQYGISTAEFETFFLEKYPSLEDYEVDLLFSPQYTPAEHNRLEYIPLLGYKALTPEEVTALKRRLSNDQLTTEFSTADGQFKGTVPVHEVFIERYVSLLKLDQPLPEALHEAIIQWVPENSRNEVNLLARDEAWRSESRQNILLAFLQVFHAKNTFSTLKASFLTNFVRTYRPASLLDMERQLESLIQSCRTDMDNISGRGFQDEYLRSLHGKEPQNKAEERDVWAHYKHMMDMAEQLKADYRQIADVAPECLQKARQSQPV